MTSSVASGSTPRSRPLRLIRYWSITLGATACLPGHRVGPWCSAGRGPDPILPQTDTIAGGHTQRAANSRLHRCEDCDQRIDMR